MFFKKIKIENHVQKNTEAGGNATPYPDEASSPSLLIKAHKAKTTSASETPAMPVADLLL